MSTNKLKQIFLKEDVILNHKPIERLCLRCDKPFTAQNNITRLCHACKNTDTWLSGDSGYSIPGGRRRN
jgi:Zn finger protein HypA/HybF involved in hydrogenase expression